MDILCSKTWPQRTLTHPTVSTGQIYHSARDKSGSMRSPTQRQSESFSPSDECLKKTHCRLCLLIARDMSLVVSVFSQRVTRESDSFRSPAYRVITTVTNPSLFSIGNLGSLYKAVWPQCWKTHEVCDHNWISAVDYLQIIGIIVGQILVGFEGDWIGRRFGLVQDALIMTLGLVMLTASWGTSLQGWVICYA